MFQSTDKRQFWSGFGLVLLGAFGFSAKAILIKLAYINSSSVDAITLMALRMLFSLPFFIVTAIWYNQVKRPQSMHNRQYISIFLLGLMGYYVSSWLDFQGLQFISAGLERVILFLYPTFVVIFSALFHRRRINRHVLFALALSYVGMILVFIEQMNFASRSISWGSLLVLGSAVIFAVFTLGSGMMTHSIGSTRFTAYTMIVATFGTLSHFVFQHGLALIWQLPTQAYGLALIMAIFSTVLPAFFMNAGIRRIGASKAAIISTTGPISTLALAFFILNEPITLVQISGTLLVLSGVYWLGKKP
ncbi:MAG: DMT family transporter [Methylovulum sp.]|jgi:drug/metabolite transporter (DMT)-like permease|nr:DMT family transporter [Methylovulum sp.]MCF7999807.1 DMT family transporter [Methylovulum sp.]